ncbi:MAG: hypothetical protein ABSF65_05750 [Candidatus Bathyarchaeia archaeon]|jgi:uncharacterized membrane protein YozB (DUF420 family)
MSILTDPYLLFATLSLTIQVTVLFLLLYGYILKRRAKFPQHALAMAYALGLHLTVIFVFMVPAMVLALIPVFVVPHLTGLTSIITLIHVPLGITAISLGLWLVLSWRNSDLNGCFKRKKIMLTTIIVWVAALAMGIAIYTILYWTALMG